MRYTHEDGTPFTKEEFLQKLKTDKEFNDEFGNKGIDQIQEIINTLKTNPDSRRMLVSAWNVNYLDEMILPPCHYGFQVYTSTDKAGIRYLSLMWNQRSVDTFLGLPFNIASYGTLLLLLAQEARMVPGHLIGSLGDVHLYNNHIEQAYEQLGRAAFKLPDIKIDNVDILNGEFDYQILGYKSHTPIKASLSN